MFHMITITANVPLHYIKLLVFVTEIWCVLWEMNLICKYFSKKHALKSWIAMMVAEVSTTCLAMDAKHIQSPYFIGSIAFLTSCRACGHSVECAMLVSQVDWKMVTNDILLVKWWLCIMTHFQKPKNGQNLYAVGPKWVEYECKCIL